MTRLALIADLHFGSVSDTIAEDLANELMAADPDAIILAGDLTMAARRDEFRQARDWLDALPQSKLIVPGNHDIPVYNIFERFLSPFQRFENAIHDTERRPLALANCAVFGLNTASSWQPHLKWQEGRVRRRDAISLSQQLDSTTLDLLRIVVAHHPFSAVPGMERARAVRRAASTLDLFRAKSVDLVLAGHTHQSYVLPISHDAGALLAVGAPTAMSDRRRNEVNGYWMIDLSPQAVELVLKSYRGGEFKSEKCHVFKVEDYELNFDDNDTTIDIERVQKSPQTVLASTTD